MTFGEKTLLQNPAPILREIIIRIKSMPGFDVTLCTIFNTENCKLHTKRREFADKIKIKVDTYDFFILKM